MESLKVPAVVQKNTHENSETGEETKEKNKTTMEVDENVEKESLKVLEEEIPEVDSRNSSKTEMKMEEKTLELEPRQDPDESLRDCVDLVEESTRKDSQQESTETPPMATTSNPETKIENPSESGETMEKEISSTNSGNFAHQIELLLESKEKEEEEENPSKSPPLKCSDDVVMLELPNGDSLKSNESKTQEAPIIELEDKKSGKMESKDKPPISVQCRQPSLGLNLLANYNSDSDDEVEEEEDREGNTGNFNANLFERALKHLPGNYREKIQEISDTDDDNDDVDRLRSLERILNNEGDDEDSSPTDSESEMEDDSSNEVEMDDDGEEVKRKKKDQVEEEKKKYQRKPPKVKGELLLEDLPPIQDLHISVPEYECLEFGRIESIVDQLVLVKSHPNTPLLDLDSVLFLEKGQRVLGEIFDVLGQVSSPMYCVRFNSSEHIKERNIVVGELVYAAPRSEYTQMMVLANIIGNRGSDASWRDDIEPPPHHLDYSDDEEEAKARKNLQKCGHDDLDVENVNGGGQRDLQVSPAAGGGGGFRPPPPPVAGHPRHPRSPMWHRGGRNPHFSGNRMRFPRPSRPSNPWDARNYQ